jgi:molybdopterin-guanine dinucleotide biosynthesis protein A
MISDYDDFPLIILCGGKSSRMNGILKGLLKFKRKFWLLEQIKRFKDAGGKHIILVFGYNYQMYLNNLNLVQFKEKTWFKWNNLNLLYLINPNPSLGQFSSIQYAAQLIIKKHRPGKTFPFQKKFDGTFILPVDSPAPGKKLWNSLSANYDKKTFCIIPRWNNRTKAFLKIIMTITEGNEFRLDKQIKQLDPKKIKYVDTDEKSIIINLNTQSDWDDYLSEIIS